MTRLVIAAAAAFLVAGCAEVSTKDKADPETALETATAQPKSENKPTEKKKKRPEKAGIGDSITLTGFGGVKIKVKLLRVIDPVTGSEFEKPDAGKRWIGVEIQMTNVGKKTYKDSPSNGATLVYGDDRQTDAAFLTGGRCGLGEFGSDARIAAGAKRRGCIPFELPTKNKPKVLQFALDSGFADEGGEWLLR